MGKANKCKSQIMSNDQFHIFIYFFYLKGISTQGGGALKSMLNFIDEHTIVNSINMRSEFHKNLTMVKCSKLQRLFSKATNYRYKNNPRYYLHSMM